MLVAMFSFRGRVNRLQYFLGALGVGAAFLGMALMVIGLSGLATTTRPTPAMAVDAVLLVVGLPLASLIGLSLQARRIRDIGWAPLIVFAAWIAALVVAGLSADRGQSTLSLLVNLAMLACLTLWPGKAGAASDSVRLAFTPSSAFAPANQRSPWGYGRRL